MENDRLNEIRELNPDYDISMHELDVCVGDNQYRLMYYVYVQHKESLILEADTTKVVDGKYPLDYANEIVESNLDTIIDYIVQSGTETYNDRTSRGFGNRWYVTFSIDTTAI